MNHHYQDRRNQNQSKLNPIFRNLKPPNLPKFIDGPEPIPSTFKSNMVALQSTERVRVSHYEKGVHLFYVQLQSLDEQLQRVLDRLQRIQLKNLRSKPSLLGMACVAKWHRRLFRVAIAKIPSDQSQDSFLCNFVDYGFSNSIRIDNLFYIPDEFLESQTFALPFSFAGLKHITFKCPIQEVNYYFKEISEERLLTLKCVPYDGKHFLIKFHF